MGHLSPVAFDIETSGLGADAVVTVAGLASDSTVHLQLNTDGRRCADTVLLETQLTRKSDITQEISLSVCASERELLERLADVASSSIDGDTEYLTAYNGETWSGGFDLPFLRSSCVYHGLEWPFPDVAYADTMEVIDQFDTGDTGDLVGVYDRLVGAESCDPFDDSEQAVETFESGDWVPLLLHNLSDIVRTRELSVLAHTYVAKSDFNMKSLAPPKQAY